MPQFIVILLSLFGGGLALGLFISRRSRFALLISVSLAVIAGICVGQWSAYRTMFARWDIFFYACISILGYFVFVIASAIAGTVLGLLIRRSCASHKKDVA